MVVIKRIPVKRKVCEDGGSTIQCVREVMRKEERIGIRVPSELKKSLIQIAKNEDRSLAQVCEIFLRSGVLSYKEMGPKYFQRFLTRQRGETKE